FLSYFWGPTPIMIWAAIVIEVIKAAITGDGWADFGVLLVMQLINGVVGWREEMNAGNAVKALKDRLAPECYVFRDGTARRDKARILVRGDLIGLKIGDVVPADCILVGNDLRQSCEVDQAALTGESLPATKHTLEKLLMGSVIKRGEQQAVVVGTGERTFFGKAAEMISSVEHKSRFQVILFHITMWLMAIALLLGVIMFIKLVVMDTAESPQAGSRFLRALSIVVVLLVASIPIAMQVVSTATMAIGAHKMAEKKIIVARLGAIEELAGMN
ncbi:H1B, partial [Symbiodinium sp. KB8]